MAGDELGAQALDPVETARRIWTAKAYADMTWPGLAKASGISEATLERLTHHTRPQRARVDYLFAIADATGVPRGFMEHGWDYVAEVKATPGSGMTYATIGVLDQDLDGIRARLTEVEQLVIQIAKRLPVLDPELLAQLPTEIPEFLRSPASEADEPDAASDPPTREPESRRRGAGRRQAA